MNISIILFAFLADMCTFPIKDYLKADYLTKWMVFLSYSNGAFVPNQWKIKPLVLSRITLAKLDV